MKRLLMVAVLLSAVAQVEAGALGGNLPCSANYSASRSNVYASGVNSYTCRRNLGAPKIGLALMSCAGGFQAVSGSGNAYKCQKRVM